MEAIKISGSVDKKEISLLADKYLSSSKINIQDENYGKGFSFLISAESKKLNEDITLYSKVGNLVSNIIMNVYVKDLIRNRTNKNFSEYSKKQKEKIIESAHFIILKKDFFIIEKSTMIENITNYLIKNNSIIIDGFVNFRLRSFLYIIDIAIEKSIRNLEREKEYDEFIVMLQYLIAIEEPKEELVNLLVNVDKYYFLDKDNNKIEYPLIKELEKELYSEGMSQADLIISALVILSPRKLVVHIEEGLEEELVTVISEVFQDRVEICKGCEICSESLKFQ